MRQSVSRREAVTVSRNRILPAKKRSLNKIEWRANEDAILRSWYIPGKWRHWGLHSRAVRSATYRRSPSLLMGPFVGTVTDSSGGVVPNAKITVQNQATGIERTAATDGTGDYLFVNLDPGTYTITASAQNLTTVKNEGVVLPARETVRSDFKLQVQSAEPANCGYFQSRSGERRSYRMPVRCQARKSIPYP